MPPPETSPQPKQVKVASQPAKRRRKKEGEEKKPKLSDLRRDYSSQSATLPEQYQIKLAEDAAADHSLPCHIAREYRRIELKIPAYVAFKPAADWDSGHICYMKWKYYESNPGKELPVILTDTRMLFKTLPLLKTDDPDYMEIIVQHLLARLAISPPCSIGWCEQLPDVCYKFVMNLNRAKVVLPEIYRTRTGLSTWSTEGFRRLLKSEGVFFNAADMKTRRPTFN